jgi:hypothetical protein
LQRVTETKPYLRAEVTEATETLKDADALEIDALQRNVRQNFQQVVQLSPVLSEDLNALASNISEPDGSPTSSPPTSAPSPRLRSRNC